MKTTTIVQTYLNTHNCNNIVVFNWMVYNYDKLEKLFTNPQNYHSEDLFKELEKVALNDIFTQVISGYGKWKVCDRTEE